MMKRKKATTRAENIKQVQYLQKKKYHGEINTKIRIENFP